MRNARLNFALLNAARLEDAELFLACLDHADLQETRLKGATLKEATLDRADVRKAKDLLFDGNRVDQFKIEGDAPDPWSVLRRQYTGPWFSVHLIFLIVFFLPYAGKVLVLSATSEAQESLVELYDRYQPQIEAVPGSQAAADSAQRWFEQRYREIPAWWVLVGWTKGWWVIGFTVVVVTYNAMRAYLTLKVGMLRDAEERSSTTPTLKEYYGLCHPVSDRGRTWVAAVVLWWVHLASGKLPKRLGSVGKPESCATGGLSASVDTGDFGHWHWRTSRQWHPNGPPKKVFRQSLVIVLVAVLVGGDRFVRSVTRRRRIPSKNWGRLATTLNVRAQAKLRNLETPTSFITWFGLWRLHRVAQVLLAFSFFAVIVNTLIWMATTWVWVSVG